MSPRAPAATLLSVLAAALAASAAPAAPGEAEPAISWALERTFGAGGPVQLVIRLDRTELDLTQDLLLEEELRIEPGFEAELPDVLPGDLDGLGLARVRDLPARHEGGVTVRRRRLTLEPERVGDCAVAERWAFFRKEGQPLEEERPLRTEPIEVHVTAVPASLDLTPPAPPTVLLADPDAPPAARWPLALAAALALALGLLLARRRARGERALPAPPPHVVARAALARLDGLGLLERGDIEGYFVTFSALLRDYVERRFGVRAPEQTTEEFLRAAERDPALEGHRAPLRAFLTLADQVKFARERPDPAEARQARDTVAAFVDATSPARFSERGAPPLVDDLDRELPAAGAGGAA